MGKYLKGILGPFSGLIGTVVGSRWRNIDYMRSRPRKSSKTPTEAQQEQRLRFKLIIEFLRPLAAVIKIGYQSYNSKESTMNAAVAYHLEKALTGVYPLIQIDYTKVVLSKGLLLSTTMADVSTAVGVNLTFTWENNAAAASPEQNDRVSFIVFNPAKNRFVVAAGTAIRSALTYSMALPADFSGDMVHTYTFFVNSKGNQVSNSIHLGPLPAL